MENNLSRPSASQAVETKQIVYNDLPFSLVLISCRYNLPAKINEAISSLNVTIASVTCSLQTVMAAAVTVLRLLSPAAGSTVKSLIMAFT